MVADDPRFKVHRKQGTLHKFEPAKFVGFVRLEDNLVQVTTSTRGELTENGVIKTQINGHRLEPLAEQTLVVVDVTYDREGGSPYIAAWAPVSRQRTRLQR